MGIYSKLDEIITKCYRRLLTGITINISVHEIMVGMIVLFYLIYSSFGMTLPWGWEHNGFIGAEKSTFATNYLTFGYKESRLGQITNVGSIETGKEQYEYYVHHPIGMALLVSFSFLVFGVHEWSARLVPILINAGTIILTYLFVRAYWNKKIAALTSFFMVFTPMFFYTRNLVAMELLVIFFTVAVLFCYITWLRTERREYLYLLFIIFAMGTFSDWQFYFIAPAVILHYFMFTKKERREKKLLFLIPLSILMFLIYLGHVQYTTGSIHGGDVGIAGNLFENLLFRLNIAESSSSYDITLPGLFEHLYKNLSQFYTKPLMFTPILFALIFLLKIYYKKPYEKDALPIIVFLSFLSSLFIFSNLYWIHGFLVLFFNPWIPLFGALIADSAWTFISRRRRYFKIIFCIFSTIILISYLDVFYDHSKEIYTDNNRITPIVQFLSQNDEDVIVSFDVHPQAYAFKFYLTDTNVKDIRKKEELISLLNNNNNFRYFLVKNKIEGRLMDFLYQNYYRTKIDGYSVFDLTRPAYQIPSEEREYSREREQYPKVSGHDATAPKLAIFSPENTTYTSGIPKINTVSDESCSFSYSWDGEGNITGPQNMYNLKVQKGEFTNDSDRSIVLELHMNENMGRTAHDDSGNGNHGNGISDNVNWIVTGKFGGATEYDGVMSYISIPDNPSLKISRTGISISAWIWADYGTWRPIVRKGTNGLMNYVLLITPDNKLRFAMDNITGSPIDSSHSVPLNRWSHVTGVYDGATLSLYINGVLDSKKNVKGSMVSTSTQDLTVGREMDQNVWFNGYLDDVIIWNRSISATEIKRIYNNGLSKGGHYIDVYCRDDNGNVGHSRKYFTIE